MRELGNILECGKNNATYVLGANRIGMELTYEKIIEAASKLSEEDKERLLFPSTKIIPSII